MMALRNKAIPLLLTFLVSANPNARADGDPIQAPEEIVLAVKQFLIEQSIHTQPPPEVEVGRVDPRLRMPRCRQRLLTFMNPGGRRLGNVTVGVRCEGDRPWTLYVSARVKLIQPVVVLSRPVARDHILVRGDARREERDVGTLASGFLTDLDAVIGQQVRRPLRAGFVLSPHVLARPMLIRRGETVTLLAGTGGFEVRSEGKALESGAAGETVSVENLRSRRVVEGTVATAGVVRVRM